MNTKELTELIKDSEKCNFIGYCGSVLQINSLNAAINYLRSKGIELNGFVFLPDNNTFRKENYSKKYFVQIPNIKYMDSSFLFADLNKQERFIYWLNIPKILSNKHRKKDIYVLSNTFYFYWIKMIYDSLPDRRIIFGEVDDGAGNYRDKPIRKLLSDVYYGKLIKLPYYALRYFINRISTDRIVPYLKKSGCYLDCKVMVDGEYGLEQNYPISEYWFESFAKNTENFNYAKIEELENGILIIPPTEDIANYDQYEKFESCVNVVKRFADANQIKVFIKPHPREINMESYDKFGCFVIKDKHMAAEEILFQLKKKPLCIVGTNSTVMVTGKVLFHVPSISILKIIQEKGWFLEYCRKHFCKHFSDVVKLPENTEELEEALKRLL